MRLTVCGEIEGSRCIVGTLETIAGQGERFSYDPAFIERFPDSPLSVALPFQSEPFGARQTRAFFKNLLPEGGALAAVARTLEVKSTSYLRILDALRYECIGAVILQNEDDSADSLYGYKPISCEELGEALTLGATGMALLQEEARLSLAGAQSKIGLRIVRVDGRPQYFLPMGTAASTHIVKSPNRGFESLSENEHYCLQLAKASGINVAESSIETVADKTIFVTKRFDRETAPATQGESPGPSNKVVRTHQEDFCQILGKQPEHKYERPGQDYARLVRDVLFENSDDPVRDVRQFAKTLILNVVLGNCDGHLKNLTASRGARWDRFRLSPAYDIASTVVYSRLDRHMAMRVGQATNIDAVTQDDVLLLGNDLSLPKRVVLRLADEVREGVFASASIAIDEIEEATGRRQPKLVEIRDFALQQVKRLGQ